MNPKVIRRLIALVIFMTGLITGFAVAAEMSKGYLEGCDTSSLSSRKPSPSLTPVPTPKTRSNGLESPGTGISR